MSMNVDRINVIDEEVDVARDAVAKLRVVTAHLESRISGLLSEVSPIDLPVRELELAN